jgi:hypothetical protein
LLTLGLATLWQNRQWVLRGLIVVLGVWTAVMPLIIIQPAYAQPAPQPQIEPVPNPQQIQFGEHIHLLGYQVRQPAVKEGEQLMVDLFWEASQPITDSYTVALALTDASGQVVASLDTIPYQGRYATAVWAPGHPFQDTYTLPPVRSLPTPGNGNIFLTLYPWRQTEKALPVTVNTIEVGQKLMLSSIKIAPSSDAQFQPTVKTSVDFGPAFRLVGYDMEDNAAPGLPFPITLYWNAVKPDGQEYTVFVHMVDASGQLVAQADSPPQANTYPTSIWAGGEQIRDEHVLMLPPDLPDGPYQILIGLYHTDTGVRLPAVQTDGERWTNDAVTLSMIHVGD